MNYAMNAFRMKEAFLEGYFSGAKEVVQKGQKLWIAPSILRPIKVRVIIIHIDFK